MGAADSQESPSSAAGNSGVGGHGLGWIAEAVIGLVGGISEPNLRDLASGAGGSPECTTCPVCQAMRRVRDTDPAVVEEFSNMATSVVNGFLTAVEAASRLRASADRDPATPEGSSSAPGDAESGDRPSNPEAPQA